MRLYYFISIYLFVIACFFAFYNSIGISLLFCLIGTIITSVGIYKTTNQYFSLTLIFWIFTFLYGVSLPFNILVGTDVETDVSILTLSKSSGPYLGCYCLASLGILFSLFINNKRVTDWKEEYIKNNITRKDVECFKRGALISAFLTSIFSVINTIRANGFILLFSGNKGLYQSAVGNLAGTLPSEIIYCIFGMFVGLLLGARRVFKFNIGVFLFFIILILSPFILTNLLLGMRGTLISAVLTGTCCYSVIRPIKSIPMKAWVLLLSSYLIMVFLSTFRGAVPYLESGFSAFLNYVESHGDSFLNNLNPSAAEFGSAAINFCVYFNSYGFSPDYYLGTTYFNGLATLIPASLYPGEKPIQITYLFRNEFFPHYADYSDIASTGFSSILEAYMNFGFIGIFFVYFLIGKLLLRFDYRTISRFKYSSVLMRSILVPICMRFSRAALGGLFAEFFYGLVFTYLIYYIVRPRKMV